MTLPPSPSPTPTQTTTPTPADKPASDGPATQPGRSTNLRYFTQSDILLKIGCRRLARLFGPFYLELRHLNLPKPPPVGEEDPIYPQALAAALAAAPALPPPVAKALLTIEAAAGPENQDRLNEILFRRLPSTGVPRDCPLDCVLEVWISCPEELSPFVPPDQPAAPPHAYIDHSHGSATFTSLHSHTSPASSSPQALTIDAPTPLHSPPLHAPTSDPDAATFLRLAKLPPAEYDRLRQSEAKRLGIRVITLDFEVARVRTQLDVESNALNLPKVIPSPTSPRHPPPNPTPTRLTHLRTPKRDTTRAAIVVADVSPR